MKEQIWHILVVCIFLNIPVMAQSQKATLYFKDGTQLTGLGKTISKRRVKFRKSSKTKPEKYSFSKLDKLVIHEDGDEKVYKEIKLMGKEDSIVLQEVLIGRLSLYKTESHGQSPPFSGNGFAPGNAGMAGGNFYSIQNYYVLKDGVDGVVHLTSSQFFGKNFKKGASAYFKDCPSLVEKIQTREYKKRDIEEIIKYYNNNCQ